MPSILIVDDDPTIRAMFARALKSLGDVEQADSGTDALRLLSTKKYSVVLLDLHMPVVDGFVILQSLASKQGPNGDTPVYLITADTSDEARLRALRRHAVFFLTKPVPIGTLISLVDSTLRMVAQRAQGGSSRTSAQPPNSSDASGGRSSFDLRPSPPRIAAGERAAPNWTSTPSPGDRPASTRSGAAAPSSDKSARPRITPLPPSPSRVSADTPVPESPWSPPESPRVRPKKG